MGVFDEFRTLFNIRRERKQLPPGPKPKLGAKVSLHDVRMTIQSGLSDELWQWLQELGFREIAFSPDRRRYRDLSPSSVARLYDAPKEEWKPLLTQAIRNASARAAATAELRTTRARA